LKSLPTLNIRLEMTIYADDVIKYDDAYFNAVVKDKARYWSLDSCEGRVMTMTSVRRVMTPNTTLDDAFGDILPSLYESNCTIVYV